MMSSPTEESVRRNSESEGAETESPEHDPHYEPIVTLPLVEVHTNEEDEEELVKIRARLYRYDTEDHEWKERTGDVKLLSHKLNNTVRVVMRRDKTLKVCANHFITPDIRMNVHCGSDKAFNWSVFADYADETCKQELLAIKFGNPQNAELWKTKFAEAQEIVRTKCSLYTQDQSSDDESSITRSEDTDTPEPKTNVDKSPDKDKNNDKTEQTDSDGVVLKLQELKVDSEKSE
ncbi:LOW QUALITY PROTEIN: ran-specific GTPase-activating protein-like [Manduca sexta]|uniref:LOW QUALITY PROTEIN: ran-specific GTPase-activating protein-like n=1 Tax=Manduca sexta TaxID=7130 RepID=UPI001890A4FE|nr:LOW QUALITY PROTEIN: ran-specific GTPase-activating protein-like [Manduca sexta]